MFSRRSLQHAVDALGLALVVTLLWRVFFTFNPSISWSLLALSIGAAGAGAALFDRRSLRTLVDAPIACYVLFTLASAAAAYGRYPAFAGLSRVAPWHPGVHLLMGVAYFYGLLLLLKTPRRLGALLAVLVIATSAIGGIAVYDHARFGAGRIWEYPLLPQWLGYPHIGLLLAVAFPLAAVVASAGGSRATVAAATVSAAVIALMTTTLYSRAALFSIAIAYAGLCAIEASRFKSRRLLIAGAALVLMIVVGLTTVGRLQAAAGSWVRPEGGLDPGVSLRSRLAVWTKTAAMIRDHPLLGVGPGNYTAALESGYAGAKFRENGHAHNMVLHVAAEQGIPAAIAFLLLWYRLGSMLIRRSGPAYQGVLAAGCFGALLAFFTRSLTDHFMAGAGSPSERTTFLMWTLLAAAASVGRFQPPHVTGATPIAAPRDVRVTSPAARVWASAKRHWDDGRLACCVMLAFGAACEAQALFTPTPAIRAAGTTPYLVDGFGAGAAVGQTFRMNADGLASVRLVFFADRPTAVNLRWRLLAWVDAIPWVPLYEWTARVDLPPGSSWQAFEFPPVVPSDGRVYQFQVQRLDGPAEQVDGARRVGLVGSTDDSLRDGNLIDGPTQIVDRDLYFEARAEDSALAVLRRNINPGLPRRLQSTAVQLTILAVYNAALAVFLYTMVVSGAGREQV